MTRSKRKNAYIAIAIIGVLAIIGVTFASIFRAQKESELSIYPVSLNATMQMSESLDDVVIGETVIDKISFTRNNDSLDSFVRIGVSYYKDGALTDDDKRFLLGANYEDITTSSDGSTYMWTRGEDGYYYLTDLSGNPIKVTSSSEYVFCENVAYTGAPSLYQTIPAPTGLKLKADIQAINAKSLTTPSIDELSTVFLDNFGSEPVYGYIVTFDTGNANAIVAQTFLSTNQTVTKPSDPILMGHEFNGWYTDSEFQNAYNFDTIVSSSFTLYAKLELPPYTFGELEANHVSGKKYYVEMGEYPQSQASVTASDVTATSEQITIYDTACTIYQNNTTDDRYVLYNSNYYLIEPVRWIILGYEEGDEYTAYDFSTFTIEGQNAYIDTAKATPYTGTNGQPGLLLLSEKVLNRLAFNPSSDGNQYSNSTLKATMARMYGELFTTAEQNLIKSTTVYSTYNDTTVHYAGDAVTTKLFPLGYHYNTSYTDNYNITDYLTADAQRVGVPTALATAIGSGGTDWWLRSGHYYTFSLVYGVSVNGSILNRSVYLTGGVRVAFVMTLHNM